MDRSPFTQHCLPCFLCVCILLVLGGCAPVREVVDDGGIRASGPIYEKDGKEVRHGLWKAWYPDGSASHVVRYTRGTRTGLYRSWFPSGERHEEIVFDWDGSEKRRRVWDRDGALLEDVKAEKPPKKPWWRFWDTTETPVSSASDPVAVPQTEE